MEPPYDMNLKTDVRRGLAAVMCVAHKLTAHTCIVGVEIYVQRIMQKFLLLSERPKWNADWAAEYEWHLQAELSVLAEPIMSLHTCNPLSEAEVEIGQLVASGKISSNDAMVMRGSCFFLVGACMLNPEKDVLETLAVRMSTTDIGCGVVSLLLTLMHTLGDPYGGFRLKRGEVLYRAPYNRNVDNAAQVMLCNATSGHANQLRVGPYRPAVQARQGAGPVQRIVDADNLMKANEVFKECMVPVS